MIKWLTGLWGATSQSKAQEVYAENERLKAEIVRKSCMPNDHRYWEGRYRDEKAAVEKLEADKGGLIKRIQNLQATIALMEAQNETEGPKRDLEKSNDAQAARAMSRNTKNDFREYQKGVVNVLAQFDKVMSKNSITKKDLDTVNSVREQMRAILRREI